MAKKLDPAKKFDPTPLRDADDDDPEAALKMAEALAAKHAHQLAARAGLRDRRNDLAHKTIIASISGADTSEMIAEVTRLDMELAAVPAEPDPIRWGKHGHVVRHDHGVPHYVGCRICGKRLATLQLPKGADPANQQNWLLCGEAACKEEHERQVGAVPA